MEPKTATMMPMKTPRKNLAIYWQRSKSGREGTEKTVNEDGIFVQSYGVYCYTVKCLKLTTTLAFAVGLTLESPALGQDVSLSKRFETPTALIAVYIDPAPSIYGPRRDCCSFVWRIRAS